MNQIAEGHPPAEAFRAAFGATTDEFDKGARVYVRRLTFLVQRFTLSEKLTIVEPSPGRAMTPDEVEAWLGTAQLRVNRVDEAAPRIERAGSASPPTAAGQLAVGLLRLERQQPTEALDAFARAAELAPDDFLTQYVSGMSRVRADPQGSEEHRVLALAVLKRAIAPERGIGQRLRRARLRCRCCRRRLSPAPEPRSIERLCSPRAG